MDSHHLADDADDFGFALVLFAYITNAAVFRWIGFDFWVDEVLSSFDSPATTDAGCRMPDVVVVSDEQGAGIVYFPQFSLYGLLFPRIFQQ